MKGFEYIKKTREYLDYIEEHLKNVRKAWDIIQVCCADMDFIKDDITRDFIEQDVLNHDLSKFSKEEFTQYRANFKPTEFEIVGKKDFSDAWKHHYNSNSHHWQNWICEELSEYKKMTYCVGMIIDWTAMGYKFGDTAQAYFESGKEEMQIPQKYKEFMYEIFSNLKEN